MSCNPLLDQWRAQEQAAREFDRCRRRPWRNAQVRRGEPKRAQARPPLCTICNIRLAAA